MSDDELDDENESETESRGGSSSHLQTLDVPASRFIDDDMAGTPTIASGPMHGREPPHTKQGNAAADPAIPQEILESRLTEPMNSLSSLTLSNATPPTSRIHRSFILAHGSDLLAQHFAMIDRELFLGLKFEELILDDWRNCEEINVLDWSDFVKARARWRSESRFPEKRSALAAVRARFNVMANFTISEIVLTRPNERPHVVAKFLRIAWVSYPTRSLQIRALTLLPRRNLIVYIVSVLWLLLWLVYKVLGLISQWVVHGTAYLCGKQELARI
jgi:Gdp/GTP exchange factor required for growth at low temperatures